MGLGGVPVLHDMLHMQTQDLRTVIPSLGHFIFRIRYAGSPGVFLAPISVFQKMRSLAVLPGS